MATKFQIKRSTVSGVVPTTSDISVAELAINVTDRKLYSSNGSSVFEIGANLSNLSVSSNVTIGSSGDLVLTAGAGVSANGSLGTAGHTLHSNGTSVYWAADDQGVTSVATGNGLTGGTITSTGTVSVLANNGITANSTGTFVRQGTGTVVNATGVHVNSAYIATIASNSATFAEQSATNTFTVGTASYFVANGNLGVGTSGPSSKLNVYDASSSVVRIEGDSQAALQVRRYSTDTSGPVNNFTKYRGTRASPAAVTTGDIAGTYGFQVYGGSTVTTMATIVGVVENFTSDADISGLLQFTTTNASVASEKMRITANGNVGIANTTPAHKLRVDGDISLSGGVHANGSLGTAGQVLTSNGTVAYWGTSSGGGATLTANNTDTQTFYLPMANTTSGSWSNAVISNTKLYFVPSTGTLNATIFNSLSDYSLKKDVEDISNAIDLVASMRGVRFKWRDNDKQSSGVIAQELETVAPELVSENNSVKNVNYDGIIAYLIEAIKEIKDRLDRANIR